MSPELKDFRSVTCLELKVVCCESATQNCEVFVESETAPLETVSLIEDLMQTKILKSVRDFRTKDVLVLKDKGLVLAT